MLKKEAREITGGLSKPSKMPGPAHNLPAQACKTGAKLVKVPGSVCAGCYALKGRYRFKNVQAALNRRLQALQDPRWVSAMVTLIKDQDWFRWHDSGDIQSLEHLKNIFLVCKQTPNTKHWMPTREAWIKDHLASKPDNLVIRFSPPMIGQRNDTWPNSSMVVEKDATCPAPSQGGKCGSCRQCWDPAVKVVSYGKH